MHCTDASARDDYGSTEQVLRTSFTGLSYLDAVPAQTAALATQLQAEDIAARRMDARVALLKALDGPWREPGEAPLASPPGQG